ncbi:MAG: hypothetical protein CSA22_09055 [Deltaproteobacteria bacterium]|nr:MAG: hypothetical protein CSA22_09055 [Deltaproteobacteria bacterium]
MAAFWQTYGSTVLLLINLGVVLGVWAVLKRFQRQIRHIMTTQVSETVLEQIEPLMREAASIAEQFDRQIQEKKALIHTLNQSLETRMAEAEQILNKAHAATRKGLSRAATATAHTPAASAGGDLQAAIIDLHAEGMGVDEISDTLSIPRGEVQLVLDLKAKFLALKNGA